MKIEICTSYDAHSSGDQKKSPSTGLTSSAPQPVRERLFGVYHRGQNRYHDST